MLYERLRAIAGRYADRDALVDADRTTSYGELLARVDETARRLAEEPGLGAGDRVLLASPNRGEWAVLFFALARLGAMTVPVHPGLRAVEVADYLDRLDLRAVATTDALRERWGDVLAGASAPAWIDLDDLPEAPAEPGRAGGRGVEPREGVAIYLSTSGSTGRPRILGRTHLGILVGLESMTQRLGIAAHHRVLAAVPFHHAHGFANVLALALLNGAALVVMRRFLPRPALALVRRQRVSVLPGSPLIFRSLLEAMDEDADLAGVEVAVSSGAGMPPGFAKRFLARTGVRVRELYGSSESGALAVEDPEEEPGATTGRALAHVVVRILGGDGREAAIGETGEVAVRTPATAARYEGEEGEVRLVDAEGFWRTGDLGRRDERDNLTIVGRLSRRLNVAGVKIDPVEIENAIASMPGVRAVRVSAATSPDGRETVRASVVPASGAELGREDVIAHCRGLLAEHKLPRVVELVASLPENVLGKSVPR